MLLMRGRTLKTLCEFGVSPDGCELGGRIGTLTRERTLKTLCEFDLPPCRSNIGGEISALT
jgi:hypothetical protein